VKNDNNFLAGKPEEKKQRGSIDGRIILKLILGI
jgi:hypothetical protein